MEMRPASLNRDLYNIFHFIKHVLMRYLDHTDTSSASMPVVDEDPAQPSNIGSRIEETTWKVTQAVMVNTDDRLTTDPTNPANPATPISQPQWTLLPLRENR